MFIAIKQADSAKDKAMLKQVEKMPSFNG